jgi:hypothetical protein
VAEFVPLFAHPRLTSDAYGKAVTRWFHAGIQVPIVIFADPTGREIPGTRLDHVQAQDKAAYLASARKALEAFRGGLAPEKAKEAWAGLGRALRLRTEGRDPGAAVADMVALRDAAAPKSPLRTSLDELLDRIDKEEAAGLVDVGRMDLEGDDAPTGIETLFLVLRDFPGLPSTVRAKFYLDKAAAAPATKEAWTAQDREFRAHLALRAADRLQRGGKEKEAKEAWAAVAKEFEGTAAATAAKSRP